jgi:tRNA A37 threonylcarbamoyladenosine synthetase subunit TsaC/SUA5/YrdC
MQSLMEVLEDNVASTVVDATQGEPVVVREGKGDLGLIY